MATVSSTTSKNEDSCDTYFENEDCMSTLKETSVKSTASLNESQDFNLLIDTEKDSFSMNLSAASETKDRAEIDKSIETNKEEPEVKGKSGSDESDEEFIEGTPPLSPSKTNMAGSRKRKMSAESSPTSKSKISKITPSEDEVCEDEDMFVADSLEKPSQLVCSDVIPETQENDETQETVPIEPIVNSQKEVSENKVENGKNEEGVNTDTKIGTEIEKDDSAEVNKSCLENGAVLNKEEEVEKNEVQNETEKDNQQQVKDANEQVEMKPSASRYSIEVIYDKKVASQDKTNLQEIIEIEDTSHENTSQNAFFDTDPEIVDILQQNKSQSGGSSTDKTVKDVSLVNISDSDYDEAAMANTSLHNSKSIDEATTLPLENSKIVQMEKEIGNYTILHRRKK